MGQIGEPVREEPLIVPAPLSEPAPVEPSPRPPVETPSPEKVPQPA